MRTASTILDELERQLAEAAQAANTIDRVIALVESKRKLGDSINRRTRELKLTLSIREVDTFVSRLLVILTEELEAHPELSERISERIRQAVGIEDDDEV